MAISRQEEARLESAYNKWRAELVEGGLLPRPAVPPYDPSKKYIPFPAGSDPDFPEAGRRRYGTLPELQREFEQIRAARDARKYVDWKRALNVEREIRRLKLQEADIAWAEQAYREANEFLARPPEQPTVRPTRGFWSGLSRRAKIGIGIGGAVVGLGILGSIFKTKEDYNTIPGLRHGGWAENTRRSFTDFGSGSRVAQRLAKRVQGYLSKALYRTQRELRAEPVKYTSRLGISKPSLGPHPRDVEKLGLENVNIPSSLVEQFQELRGYTGKKLPKGFASQTAFGTYTHELFEAARFREERLSKGIITKLSERGRAQRFGSHLHEQVIRDEAFLAYSMGPEAFKASAYFRALEGRSSLQENFALLRIARKVKKLPSTTKEELAETIRFEEQIREELKSAPAAQYIRRVADIYKETKISAPKRLKELGLKRGNITSEQLQAAYPWIKETSKRIELLERGHTPRIAEYLSRNPGAARFSAKSDAYNTIPGLHPGSEGLGANKLRQHSQFGSGFEYEGPSILLRSLSWYFNDPDGSKSNTQAAKLLSEMRDNEFKFASMPNSGRGLAPDIRESLTEFKGNFASRWDPLKKIASTIFRQGTEAQRFSKFVKTSAFANVLAAGKQVKSLGKGRFGESFLYESAFRGQKFRYVVKQSLPGKERFLQQEYTALSEIAGEIMPSAYKLSGSKLYMEYMPGKTLQELFEQGAVGKSAIEGSITKQIEKQAKVVAGKGFENLDIHAENIMYDVQSGRTSWIDFGLARREADEWGFDNMIGAFKHKISRTMKKFPGMPNSNAMAARIREDLTEFKADFASRWDPLRKLATKVFKGNEEEAFRKLTKSEEFKGAIREAFKKEGKRIGAGQMGEARSYSAMLNIGKHKQQFEFVAKRDLPFETAGLSGTEVVRRQTLRDKVFQAETTALEELGTMRAPSLYGTGEEYGLKNTVIMEKFQEASGIATGSLKRSEHRALDEFMREAHRRGITHTDLHGDNIVRFLTSEGKQEVGIIDWGMANRFMESAGVGGHQAGVIGTEVFGIVQRAAQEKVGRAVTMHEYSQIADLMRLSAQAAKYTPKGVPKVASYNINIFYHHLMHKTPETAEKVKRVVSAAFEFGEERGILPIEDISNVARSMMAATPKSNVVEDATMNMLPERTVVAAKAHKKLIKKEDLADADTVMANTIEATTLPAASVKTVNANMRRAAVRRNKKFAELSRQSVGIGLRSAHKGNKGHTAYATTVFEPTVAV